MTDRAPQNSARANNHSLVGSRREDWIADSQHHGTFDENIKTERFSLQNELGSEA